jgi:hypothetical protein
MAFPDSDLPLIWEAAFGADPEASPGTWTFTDLSSRHLDSVVNLRTGRRAGSKTAEPSAVGALFNNHDGDLTPLRAMSAYHPNIKLDTPFRCNLRRADDTFTRTTSNGWGTSTSLHVWTTSGGAAADYSTSGTQGSVAVSATGSDRMTLVDLDGRHQDVRITATTNGTPSGGTVDTGVVARYADSSNYYIGAATVSTGGIVTATIAKRVAGSLSTVTSISTGLSTATSKKIRFRVIENRLQLKIWLTSATEPDAWHLDILDDSLTNGDMAGSYSRRGAGNSTPTTFTYDNFDTTHALLEGFTDSWKPAFIPTTDGFTSVVRVTASGPLRRLGQGSRPLRSPLFRTISGVAQGDYIPNAYWPMEDGTDATAFSSGLAGGESVAASGVSFAAATPPAGSEALAELAAGAAITFPIPSYTDTGHWMFTWLMNIPAEPASDLVYAEIRSAGTAKRITLSVAPGTPGRVYVRTYDAANTLIAEGFNDLDGFPDGAHPTEDQFYGNWVMHGVMLTPDVFPPGDSLCWQTMSVGETTTGIGGSDAGSLTGAAQSITLFGNTGAGFGHLGFFKDDIVGADPDFYISELKLAFNANVEAMDGHTGETEIERFARLSREEKERFTALPGYDGVPMGPQLIDTFMANALDCETAGQGVIGEDNFGLTYIPRAARVRRPVGITIDLSTYRATAGTSLQVFSPIFDDQAFRNEWTVSRPDGSSIIASDFSRVKLPYEDSADPNLETDAQLVNDATWRLSVSSVEAMRWPNAPVDLFANPAMIGDWLGAVCGLTRVIRTGLPAIGPDGDIDELLDGIEHTIRRRAWTLDYAASPAMVYNQVGVYGTDAVVSRYDSAHSTLAAGYSSSATSFSVATVAGHALWTVGSSGPTFPFDISVSGIRIRVTAISGASSPQTFTVTRSMDGYDKALSSGAQVRLWDPARFGL